MAEERSFEGGLLPFEKVVMEALYLIGIYRNCFEMTFIRDM